MKNDACSENAWIDNYFKTNNLQTIFFDTFDRSEIVAAND